MTRVSLLLAVVMAFSVTSTGQPRPDPNRPGAREKIKYDVPDQVDIDYEVLDNIDTSITSNGVVPLPENLGKTLNGLFSKYTKHVAPNGKPIHIFAQSRVSDLQLVRAREILKYHLTDAPGTKYGSDKTAIANRMGDVRATLVYTDTQARSFALRPILRDSELRTQDLYATESPVEGSYTYIHNQAAPGEFFTRDASYEEIMHLVHAKGIEDALPAYHQAIVKAEKRAVDAGIYRYGRPAPHEYIINGFDIYFGLWEHNPQGDGTAFGDEYPFHSKAEMKAGDRPLYDLVDQFWLKYLTYNAYIDPTFEGTFSTVLDKDTEYTLKSRYLVNITLTGDKNSNILGNDQGNRLTGNAGDNTITGGAGNDVIAGGEGSDTAVFSGRSSEYEIIRTHDKITVTDTISGRDGTDELTDIEVLKFSDKEVTPSTDYAQLLSLFREFREFQEPKVVDGVPDYTAEAMEEQYGELKAFQRRLAAIDPSGWSTSDQIDYHLVRAEMNGLEFRHRVLRPWSRDPGFYNDVAPRLPWNLELPLPEQDLAGLKTTLQAIPGFYNQAERNLENLSEVAGDLAVFAIHNMEGNGSPFADLVSQLAEHHPDLVSDAKKAQTAMDDYLRWLKKNQGKMTASAGVGIENYNWLLKNVYLFPYTWDEVRTIVELEDNRVITFQKLEENRNRKLPPLRPVASQEERRQSVQEAVQHVMDFLRDEEIFTVQDYLVTDEYLESNLRRTYRPWPEKHDYFFNFSHREPVMEETHELVGHHFDLLRVWQDERPIRGNREHEGPYYMAVARLEGFAFALEELLMHAGYLDERPRRGREIAYEQAAFRTVRALSDVYMHSAAWSLKDAMEYCVANAPHGELLDDSPHLWHEMETTLRQVGWHAQMVVGKVHFMKLLRDTAQQRGDEFNLRQFMDEFFAAGVIPTSLIRWEMTGYDDEIKELW
jgi:hypothetical protein